jgi:hypothetical protein
LSIKTLRRGEGRRAVEMRGLARRVCINRFTFHLYQPQSERQVTCMTLRNWIKSAFVATASLAYCLVAAQSHATTVLVPAKTFSRLCPTIFSGDREFDGHGPEVTTNVALRSTGGQVFVDIHLREMETQWNWTGTEGSWSLPLAQAPSGNAWNSIWAPDGNGVYGWRTLAPNATYDQHDDFYVDTDWNLRRNVTTGHWWLTEVATLGDTKGDDVVNCTADDAYINVSTAAFYLSY